MPTGQFTTKYQHTDALGSPVAVTDSNRTVIERTTYEPYGKATPSNDGPGYTGHVEDAATGLTYMQQRYYDPAIGRFLSVDPVSAYEKPMTNFNRYVYAQNNPYRFADPDGRQALDQSAKYLAEYRDCAASSDCDPLTVPDRIAQREEPYAKVAGFFVPVERALVGVAKLAGLVRFAPALRPQRQVAETFRVAGTVTKNGAGQTFKLAEGKITVRVMEQGGGRTTAR